MTPAVVLVAGALICALGVIDDLIELDALTKLGGQVLVAGFLIYFDVQYRFFPFPAPGGGQFSLEQSQARAADRGDRGRRRSTR